MNRWRIFSWIPGLPSAIPLTALADLFFLCILIHYGMGGWENAIFLLSVSGFIGWFVLGLVVLLVLHRSDYRADIPLFIAGLALGYWGEWWGTTRGIWTYWNGATPPDYLPPLWGIGLLTVYRLAAFLSPWMVRARPRWGSWLMSGSFLFLPLIGLALSAPLLWAVNWRGRLDLHFWAGIGVGLALVFYRFNLGRAFPLYLCGMLLGGTYEYLGTSLGEWSYITGETPPLWIIPLWGLAAVAMTNLASNSRTLWVKSWEMGRRVISVPAKQRIATPSALHGGSDD